MDRKDFMNAETPFAVTAAGSKAGAQSSNVDHAEVVSESKPPLFPDNAQFWYEARRAFGAASYGASEFGEVLVTAGRIRSGDFDSWYEEWNRWRQQVKSLIELVLRAQSGIGPLKRPQVHRFTLTGCRHL